jgi:hypothetical protein
MVLQLGQLTFLLRGIPNSRETCLHYSRPSSGGRSFQLNITQKCISVLPTLGRTVQTVRQKNLAAEEKSLAP